MSILSANMPRANTPVGYILILLLNVVVKLLILVLVVELFARCNVRVT
jgi:hypothetical protein